MKRKIISTLLCVSMCAALMMGCGQSDKSDTKENKKTEESKDEAKDDKLDLGLDVDSVTVATSPGYEPFEFEEDGELKGYDVDIWNEFSERTGIEVKWEYADFSGLLGLLSSGKADAVSAQMSPTEERKDSYLFSDPVDYYGSTVVVAKDNDEIKSVKDLSGKTVGVGSGNSMQQKTCIQRVMLSLKYIHLQLWKQCLMILLMDVSMQYLLRTFRHTWL